MKIIEINNFLKDDFYEKFTDFLVKYFFLEVKVPELRSVKVVDLSVVIASEQEITKINKVYRKESYSTDVLSFCYEKSVNCLEGELIICPQVVRRYAIIDEMDFLDEYAKNVFHGLLHIWGFNHGEQMFVIQEDVIEKIKIKDEYKKIKNQFKKRA